MNSNTKAIFKRFDSKKSDSQQNSQKPQEKKLLPDIKIEDVNNDHRLNVNILSTHPLIRMREFIIKIGKFVITIITYSFDTRIAKDYGIKTISDDGIYEQLPYMKKLMPRGLSFVTFTNEEGNTETVVFFGFRKFSGMEDDEETIDNDKVNNYFRKGTMADVTHFMETEKSNGENAKWTIRNIFGKNWVFAGSKNTCKVFPLGEDPCEWYPINSIEDYGNIIAFEVYLILNKLKKYGKIDEFADCIIKNEFIIMGELNHPDSEHVFPILNLKIEHVALLGPDGNEINPVVTFNFFDKFELPSVFHSLNLISELNKTMQETFECKTSEGKVFYLLQETDNGYIVLTLLKHKSSFYVIVRRIRQIFWKLIEAIIEFPEMDNQMVFSLLEICHRDLRTKIPKLTFLPNCESKKEEWVKMGIEFTQRWYKHFTRSTFENKIKMLEDAKHKYGTTYEKFNGPCENEDFKEEEKEEGESPNKIILLRGPSGAGKTHKADELVTDFSKKNMVAVVVSADDYFKEKGQYIPKDIHFAHKDCQSKTLSALRKGYTVIVANTNIQLWEMKEYLKISQIFNVSIEIVNIDAFDGEIPLDWKNKDKKNALSVAKILSARTKDRDTWRKEIPEGIITGQIAKFEPLNSIVDIFLAKTPPFVQSAPPKGVYNKGYAGFSHSILLRWVQTAVEMLLESGEHSDILTCYDNASLRDFFERHITLAFWKHLPKDLDQKTFMNNLRNLKLKDFNNRGVGFCDGLNGNRSYYLVIECPRLLQIYKSFGIEKYFPTLHVTVGFRFEDIHGVSKGIETLIS
jgi:predicted kinase